MFKRFILSAIILSIALLPKDILAQEVKTLTIGINSDVTEAATGTLLQELKTEINAVLGSAYTVVYKPLLISGDDLDKAKANYAQRLQDDSDLILTFGAPNAIAVYLENEYPKPTIAFGSINKDILNLPPGQSSTGVDNLNYVITPNSYTEDLKAFKSLYAYKNLGVIVDDFTAANLPVTPIFDSYFSGNSDNYTFLKLNNDGTIQGDFSTVDAIYLTTGFTLTPAQLGNLVEQLNSENLPSFSGISLNHVKLGILATQQPEDNVVQIFRRIALRVEAVARGENLGDLPLFLDFNKELSINYNTAKTIEFPLRYSMLATTNFLGGNQEAVPTINYSLIDLMNGVISGNLSLNASKLNVDLAQQDVKTAKSNYLPNATANATAAYVDPKLAEVSNGSSPEFSTSGNLTVQQLLYSPEASAGVSIQQSVYKAEQQTYSAAQLDALLDAAVAYFNALVLKTNVQIQNENLQLTKLNLQIADQNFEAGASGKGDVLRFRSQLAQNTQALITADNNIRQALYSINQLLNSPINTDIGVQDAAIASGIFKDYNYNELLDILDNPKLRPFLIEFLIAEAKTNAPELKNIAFNLEANERNYNLSTTGRFIPTVSLQGQYNLTFSQSGVGSTVPAGFPVVPDGYYNVGLNLSLPILNQNQNNINRQTALIQKEQLGLQERNINLSIELNVNNIVLDLMNEIANIEISQVSEDNARESLELVQSEYKNGAVPVIQLIDAQNNFLQAQLQSATANYNYLLTAIQLERIIGYFFLMHSEQDNQEFIQRANQYILSRQ